MDFQISGIGDLSKFGAVSGGTSLDQLASASLGGFNVNDLQGMEAPASRGDGASISDEAHEENQQDQGPSPEQQKFELEHKIHFLDQQIQQANFRMQTMESDNEEGGQDLRSKDAQNELNKLTQERGDLQMQLAQLNGGGGGAGGSGGGGGDIGGLLGGIGKAVGGLLGF